MRRAAHALPPPAHTAADGELRLPVVAFTAGVVGCRMVRYTSAFAQCSDARDTRVATYVVRLQLTDPAQATQSLQTGMRGLMVVGT